MPESRAGLQTGRFHDRHMQRRQGAGSEESPQKVRRIVPGIFLEAIVTTPNLRHIHPIEIFPFATARISGSP